MCAVSPAATLVGPPLCEAKFRGLGSESQGLGFRVQGLEFNRIV